MRPPSRAKAGKIAIVGNRAADVATASRPQSSMSAIPGKRPVIGRRSYGPSREIALHRLVSSGSSSSEPLPLLPLRAPDLNARHGVDLPRTCPPGANIPDVLVVVKEPPRDADSRLKLAEVEERLVGPVCRRRLEVRGHLGDDLLVP